MNSYGFVIFGWKNVIFDLSLLPPIRNPGSVGFSIPSGASVDWFPLIMHTFSGFVHMLDLFREDVVHLKFWTSSLIFFLPNFISDRLFIHMYSAGWEVSPLIKSWFDPWLLFHLVKCPLIGKWTTDWCWWLAVSSLYKWVWLACKNVCE